MTWISFFRNFEVAAELGLLVLVNRWSLLYRGCAGLPKTHHCPVPGCKTVAPHTDDPTVKGLCHNFSDPAKLALWTAASIAELGNSMATNLVAERNFALITRSRQPEELYIRALYAIFIATPDELAHMMSDMLPNGFRNMYRKVNQLVFEGRGLLEVSQPGLKHGDFTPMDTINRAAYGSFSRMMVIGVAQHPEYLEPYTSGRYFNHISVYCTYVGYLQKMFEGGKDKAAALSGLINMHRPKSFWEAQAKAAKRASKETALQTPCLTRQGLPLRSTTSSLEQIESPAEPSQESRFARSQRPAALAS
jgi:hypothetical protein